MGIEDLYTLEAHEKGAELRLINPNNGKPTEFYLTIVGRDSVTWRDAELAGKRKLITLSQKELKNPAVERELIAEALAGAVIGWRGFEKDGEEIELDREFVRKIFINSPPIADQVDNFLSDRINFIKG